jgi:hypothetical protein
MEINALIDCGAEGRFINRKIVNWADTKKLKEPILVQNVDGTINKEGMVK